MKSIIIQYIPRIVPWITVFVILGLCTRCTESFTGSKMKNDLSRTRMRPKPSVSSLSSSSQSDKDAALRFGATYSYTTSPVHIQCRNSTNLSSSLHSFFEFDGHRDCLLVGSGNIQVRKSTSSLSKATTKTTKDTSLFKKKLDRLWKREASFFHSHGIEESSHNIQMVDILITTPFLVFVINAAAVLGVKLTKDGECQEIFTDGKVHSPEFQFLLLTEDFTVDGPPPLVWVFKQLTERYQNKPMSLLDEGNEPPHIIHTYLRVWASDSKPFQGDIKADRIVFKACCRAEIEIKFPLLLLRILPVAKEIIEKQGNLVLQQSMERDIVPGVNNFREAFIRYERRKGNTSST